MRLKIGSACLVFSALLWGCGSSDARDADTDGGGVDAGPGGVDIDRLEEEAVEPTLEPLHTFTCLADQVDPELVIREVSGSPGDVLLIRPAGSVPCYYDLIYRTASGVEHTLSQQPGGYLLALARRFSDGTTLVCASNILHRPVAGGTPGEHTIDAVPIECAAHTDGTWTALDVVVEPEGDWAAWVKEELRRDDSRSGTYLLTFAHDFTFQFLNAGDRGRPEDDGIYDVVLSFAAGGVEPLETTMISSVQNPLADAVQTPWEPTAEEREELADHIDFSDGPCADGCPADAGPAPDAGL